MYAVTQSYLSHTVYARGLNSIFMLENQQKDWGYTI